MAAKFKKGDSVLVIAGKYKGKKGVISAVNPKKSLVTVQGVGVVQKRLKPTASSPYPRVVEQERPLHQSNVMHVDPRLGIPTKIGFRLIEKDGVKSKVRYAKKSGEEIS